MVGIFGIFSALLLIVTAQTERQTVYICSRYNQRLCPNGFVDVWWAQRISCKIWWNCCDNQQCLGTRHSAHNFYRQMVGRSNVMYDNSGLPQSCYWWDCGCTTTVNAEYQCAVDPKVVKLTRTRNNASAEELSVRGTEVYLHLDGPMSRHRYCTVRSTKAVQLTIVRAKLLSGSNITINRGDNGTDWIYNDVQDYVYGINWKKLEINSSSTPKFRIWFQGFNKSGLLFFHFQGSSEVKLVCSTQSFHATATMPATNNVNAGAVAGGVLAALLVALLVAIGVVMWRRKLFIFGKGRQHGTSEHAPEVSVRQNRVDNVFYGVHCENEYADIDAREENDYCTKYEDIDSSSAAQQSSQSPNTAPTSAVSNSQPQRSGQPSALSDKQQQLNRDQTPADQYEGYRGVGDDSEYQQVGDFDNGREAVGNGGFTETKSAYENADIQAKNTATSQGPPAGLKISANEMYKEDEPLELKVTPNDLYNENEQVELSVTPNDVYRTNEEPDRQITKNNNQYE